MLLITSSSFLSFSNLHSEDHTVGFSSFLVNQVVTAERKDYIQQEGEVLGRLISLVDKIKPFVDQALDKGLHIHSGLDSQLIVRF
jgi:hypothetical protein